MVAFRKLLRLPLAVCYDIRFLPASSTQLWEYVLVFGDLYWSTDSTNFQITSITIQLKLAWAVAHIPKAFVRTHLSCCLATSGMNTAGSVRSRGPDVTHTAVKRKIPTPLPVFAALNFARSWKRNPARLLGKCCKNSTVREIYNFPGHVRSTKLNFSATVLTLGLKVKIFRNLRLY